MYFHVNVSHVPTRNVSSIGVDNHVRDNVSFRSVCYVLTNISQRDIIRTYRNTKIKLYIIYTDVNGLFSPLFCVFQYSKSNV